MNNHCCDILKEFESELPASSYNLGFAWRHNDGIEVEARLASCLLSLTTAEINQYVEARGIVDFNLGYKLAAFGMRMATFAVRSGNDRCIVAGIMALFLVGDSKVDLRDMQAVFAILYDASKRIGADFEKLCGESSFFATDDMRSFVDCFFSAPASCRTLRGVAAYFHDSDGPVCYRKLGY